MESKERRNAEEYRIQIVWRKVFFMIYLHLGALYGIYLCFTAAKWGTIFFGLPHYTFSLTYPNGKFFMQKASIFEWSRDHRVHHKYSETDADPYNSKRGFFFAHMGWLMVRKHPKVIEMGKKIDIKDLLDDKIVQFQHK
ncbi:acyl-CoA Delta(11) desaturase-like isoform X2 [Dinothrombium tinctorium]|uniref:Acyl-CoA Delta(11) desaturase-like isoform X2 n=1 Tax=Dinothrombium tinctorium TaxID=1965070 RepID=A0A443R546_9ACAR|nr:acyl-CoA Delta(11) desaturase-like isoform X2 [Dinothrombium tinctorium]